MDGVDTGTVYTNSPDGSWRVRETIVKCEHNTAPKSCPGAQPPFPLPFVPRASGQISQETELNAKGQNSASVCHHWLPAWPGGDLQDVGIFPSKAKVKAWPCSHLELQSPRALAQSDYDPVSPRLLEKQSLGRESTGHHRS